MCALFAGKTDFSVLVLFSENPLQTNNAALFVLILSEVWLMRKLVLNMENSQKIFFSAANGLQANLIFFELLKYDTNDRKSKKFFKRITK